MTLHSNEVRQIIASLEAWFRFLVAMGMVSAAAWFIFGRFGLGLVLAVFGGILMLSLLGVPAKKGGGANG